MISFTPLIIPIPSSSTSTPQQKTSTKKKRNQPGNPDPHAEVIALSPKTLMTTNRFVCEICSKGFQRDQNLQLHRRGHNLPWKLRQKGSGKEAARKKVYVCPEPSCVHHLPSRALGDLTGIKKHFSRKHGEKVWRCDKCSKKYAVMSDWKAHTKTCGTREYRCDCGTLFSRKDSFVTHRAFCDALAEESARLSAAAAGCTVAAVVPSHHLIPFSSINPSQNPNHNHTLTLLHYKPPGGEVTAFPFHPLPPSATSADADAHAPLSATALLQKASTMGVMASAASGGFEGLMGRAGFGLGDHHHQLPAWESRVDRRLKRDLLGGVAPAVGAVDEQFLSSFRLDFPSSPAYLQGDPSTTAAVRVGSGFPFQTWGNC